MGAVSMSMTRRKLPLVAVLLSAAACAAAAQPATAEAAPETPAGVGIKVSFRPSVAIVVGIFTMIFSLTFLLLMYAKFCHPAAASSPTPAATVVPAAAGGGGEEGVAKAVIESLPFFRFAALRGARQGLECAVCLARFDDADLLRLLPRCRHAFHLDCVDRWLESKASCPLCRARVDAAALGLKYAACSARFVFGGSSDRFDNNNYNNDDPTGRDLLGIFVERVPSSSSSMMGMVLDSNLEAPAAAPQQQQHQHHPHQQEPMDRYQHRIVVSDAVFKSRWSEINSSDLIALDNELLRSMSSCRFPFPDPDADLELELELYGEPPPVDAHVKTKELETDRKKLLDHVVPSSSSSKGKEGGSSSTSSIAIAISISSEAADAARMISSGVRSMSEMVSLPRLRAAMRERLAEEEQARRRWVPIARRTARWFAGRERRKHVNDDEEAAAVDSPAPHDSDSHV